MSPLPLTSIQEHRFKGVVMQLVITSIAVIAGLVFSIAIALLVEEFIFGEVFRLFFAPQAVERVRARSAAR
jgi:hypothetical protein